ncbi:unnamed protein product, partial [Rotaria magnacalcarata]
YDPLLNLYLMDLNRQQEQSVFPKAKLYDEFPKAIDHSDSDSIGGGGEI